VEKKFLKLEHASARRNKQDIILYLNNVVSQ